MSKLLCRCGNIISDVVVPCPTEAWLFPQQDDNAAQEKFTTAVEAFLSAIRDGRREEWVLHFFLPGYPLDLADSAIISDIRAHCEQEYGRSVAECEKCGRLWVQSFSGQNAYRSYSPDEGGYAAVLRGTAKA
ncbi:hypothetical protein NA78x_004765 [Anatilimnocola sp. NA78]|uniref:hypothetical protein n=1 Tax=Anatilimnocola sp. NA78 TaxID=3415683 RepID=UPI003CE4491D